MNKFNSIPNHLEPVQAQENTSGQQEYTLRAEVERSLGRYFENLEDETVTDLHHMVIAEVEVPLIETVMRYCGNNQSKASIMLGLNRGTLRTKLKLYGLL
ncbi:DNA-binding transcriptional regulator Fis [Gammaproteobacteria bacterium]|nr:DNA-binding transcriptional regulator Fis [Gammaproteobacteria bacterium]